MVESIECIGQARDYKSVCCFLRMLERGMLLFSLPLGQLANLQTNSKLKLSIILHPSPHRSVGKESHLRGRGLLSILSLYEFF